MMMNNSCNLKTDQVETYTTEGAIFTEIVDHFFLAEFLLALLWRKQTKKMTDNWIAQLLYHFDPLEYTCDQKWQTGRHSPKPATGNR